MAHIISSVRSGKITNNSAKELLSLLFNGDARDLDSIIQEENMLVQNIADEEYTKLAKSLVEANPDMVRAIKEKGELGKMMWFVGQMVREMSKKSGGGGANPEKSKIAVLTALNLPAETKEWRKGEIRVSPSQGTG